MSDSKLPDAQAGAEKGYNHALVGNAGANLIYEAAGMHGEPARLLPREPGDRQRHHRRSLRTIRGIEVNDETLSVEVIREVCMDGPATICGPADAGADAERLFYPGRRPHEPEGMGRAGPTDVVERAAGKAGEILGGHFPAHLARSTPRSATACRFACRRSAMRPGVPPRKGAAA